MTGRGNGISEEVDHLIAELCDGEITPEKARRLERLVANSEPARRYLLQYLKLHGELCWEAGHVAGLPF